MMVAATLRSGSGSWSTLTSRWIRLFTYRTAAGHTTRRGRDFRADPGGAVWTCCASWATARSDSFPRASAQVAEVGRGGDPLPQLVAARREAPAGVEEALQRGAGGDVPEVVLDQLDPLLVLRVVLEQR